MTPQELIKNKNYSDSVKNEVKAKVLLLGCGNIAGWFDIDKKTQHKPLTHAGGYVNHGGFQLLACVDTNIDNLNKFSSHWKIPYKSTSLTKLLREVNDFDVVSICTPTDQHENHIIDSLGFSPKIIFCEKPLTADLNSTIRVVNEARKRNTKIIPNFSRHWDPSLSKLIEDFKSGKLGKLRSVVGHYNKGLLNNGSHLVSLLIEAFGSIKPLYRTSGVYDFDTRDPTIGCLLHLTDHNVEAYLNPTNFSDYSILEVDFYFEKKNIKMLRGGMYWQEREITESQDFKGYKTLGRTKTYTGGYIYTIERATHEIYQVFSKGKLPSINEFHALEVQKICNEIINLP